MHGFGVWGSEFGVWSWDEISAACSMQHAACSMQQSAGYLVTYYYCIVIKEGKCGLAETD